MPTIVLTVAFPVLSACVADMAVFTRVTRQALRVILLVKHPVRGRHHAAPGRITALRFPATFSQSWRPTQLLAIQIQLVAADMVIGTALNASGRQRLWALTAVTAAILNPLANLAGIPLTQQVLGSGAVCAAAITTLTELHMMVVGLRLLGKGGAGLVDTWPVLKVSAACLPMAVVAWLLRDLPVMVPVAAGSLVYLVTVLLTRLVSRADLIEVRDHLVRRTLQGRAS